MKWFKHQSDSSRQTALSELIDKFGVEGYGRYWLLVEAIADRMGTDNTDCSAEYSLAKWSSILKTRAQKLDSYLEEVELLLLFKVTRNGQKLIISCPNLREYRDNYTKDLQATCKRLASKEVEVEVEREEEKKEEPVKVDSVPAAETSPKEKPKKANLKVIPNSYMIDTPAPKDQTDCDAKGKTLYLVPRNDEEKGGWWIPTKNRKKYIEKCGSESRWEAQENKIEAWLYENISTWETIIDFHLFIMRWLGRK